MIFAISTTPEADAQIRTIDEWWRQNRGDAPDLFLDELAKVFDLLSHIPQIGRRYPYAAFPGVRRLLLQATRYHVYYATCERQIQVLAVWHGERGIGPQLKVEK